MEEKLILIGFSLIILGVLLIFIGSILGQKVKTEWGFFGFIGPIPIGAWSSERVFVLTITIFIIFMIILIFLLKGW